MSENIDPKAKQDFLTMIGHSLEVLEGGLISDVNRQSIRNGILETISELMDQRAAANARAEAAEARAERLQAVIIGMFPMWINAMSYCEHGRQSELLAMRNYYNGRANPMTNDDISLMFSVIPEKNEGGGE